MARSVVVGAVNMMTRYACCPPQSGTACFCIYCSPFTVDWCLSLNSFLWLERERAFFKDVSGAVEFHNRSFALEVYIEQQISSVSCRFFDSVHGKWCDVWFITPGRW